MNAAAAGGEFGLSGRGTHRAHVAADNPEAYIPGDRRRALAAGVSIPDRIHGAALFADISGFTPLTEALANELGPQRGAEELTSHLNQVFQGLISELDRYGGEVIYFSGDAITCWIDRDEGLRAIACAFAMQDAMARMQEIVTPGGSTVRLGIKVAIAVGDARRFVVGDPNVQLMDVLAGRLVDALAETEHHANPGEIVVDESTLATIRRLGKDGTAVEVGQLRHDADSRRLYAVVTRLLESVEPATPPSAQPALPTEIVRQWLLPAVYQRLLARRGEFMAELRPAYPLFVRFGGMDYDRDDDAHEALDRFVRSVQQIVTSFGGNLVHLALGDKGAYLYAVFGSPTAHEDDGARAAAAALEIRHLSDSTAARDIQIGITYGRLRSGMYGHPRRQAFTCLGDAVNLAARLMTSAPPGAIYATEPVRVAAGAVFEWERLAPIKVKGKADAVTAFCLTGSKGRAARTHSLHELPLVGRWRELQLLSVKSDAALAGQGQVVGIAADAGMGKSRLLADLVRTAAEHGKLTATGECQAYGTHTSYFVWRDVWTTLFGLDQSLSPAKQVAVLEAQLAGIDPTLAARTPVLGALLDLAIPDNELTASFDAKLRKASLESLLVDCLRAKAQATPLLIVLEDCHWIDPLSRDLLEVLARAIVDLRVMMAVAYRPARALGGDLNLARLPYFEEMSLTELDEHFAAELIQVKAQRMLGTEVQVPEALVKLVTSRAQGNPFYIEELLNFITSQRVDFGSQAALKNLELPESLHSLVLSRIDGVSEAPRQTLKVASVIGRAFAAPMLPGAYPEIGSLPEVIAQLSLLAQADLVGPDVEAEQTYLFKHAITQQVAYESLPFSLRALLHERVGGFIERSEPEAIERHVDLLAHHFWHTENAPKKREYLHRAGVAAQAAYANAAAIDYFERLAPLIDGESRVDVLLKLGKVLELVGNWKRAEEVDLQALQIATSLGDAKSRASCETGLAEVARKQGRFDEALERLDRAAAQFDALSDDSGLGLVKHLAGTVAAQRGDYPRAVQNYQASLVLRERVGDKASMGSVLSNLGIVAEYRGDYEESRRLHERALQLRTDIGDRRGIGNSTTNLGMIAVLQKEYAQARDWFERSLALNREVGDAWMVALCYHNLANATRGLGDYDAARLHYLNSLGAFSAYGDRWALVFLLEDIGILLAADGNPAAALKLLGAADGLRKASDMPRAPSRQQEIDAELAPTVAAVSDVEQDVLRTYGLTLSQDAAVECALAFLKSKPWSATGSVLAS